MGDQRSGFDVCLMNAGNFRPWWNFLFSRNNEFPPIIPMIYK
jgi:hypothetical protein